MRRTAWVVFVGLAVGCFRSDPPASEPRAQEPDETLVVYSLEPAQISKLKESDLEPGQTLYCGWLVLGSTSVTDSERRKEVLTAV